MRAGDKLSMEWYRFAELSPGVQPGFGFRDWRQSLKDELARLLAHLTGQPAPTG